MTAGLLILGLNDALGDRELDEDKVARKLGILSSDQMLPKLMIADEYGHAKIEQLSADAHAAIHVPNPLAEKWHMLQNTIRNLYRQTVIGQAKSIFLLTVFRPLNPIWF
jgi:hypothetical protein